MEAIRTYEWAQDKLDELTDDKQKPAFEEKRKNRLIFDDTDVFQYENRAQRRKREREELKAAKKGKSREYNS